MKLNKGIDNSSEFEMEMFEDDREFEPEDLRNPKYVKLFKQLLYSDNKTAVISCKDSKTYGKMRSSLRAFLKYNNLDWSFGRTTGCKLWIRKNI